MKRRAHTINAHVRKSAEFLKLTGRVTVSNQEIKDSQWYQDCADKQEDTSQQLVPVSALVSTFVDADGITHTLDINPVKDSLNALFHKLTALSDTAKQAVNSREGKLLEHQWYLSKDEVVYVKTPQLIFRIRPLLYQPVGDEDRSRKLLIGISTNFEPVTKANEDW